MQTMFDLRRAGIPDCWVMNRYGPDAYIRWQHHDHVLFQTQQNEVEIFSLTLGSDVVFCVQPRFGSAAALALGLDITSARTSIEELDLRTAVLAKHGAAMLMTGWFQCEWHHRTIPSNQWDSCWADVARSATTPPTLDHPQITIIGKYIRMHNCPQHSLRSKATARKERATASAGPKNEQIQKLEKQIRGQTGLISTYQNAIEELADQLDNPMNDIQRRGVVSQMEKLERQIKHCLADKANVVSQLYQTEQELDTVRATTAERDQIIWQQQMQMGALGTEIQRLKDEKDQDENMSSGVKEPPKKKGRMDEKSNAERLHKLNPGISACASYRKETELKLLSLCAMPQVIPKGDNLFKKGTVRKQHTHRVLLAFDDVTKLFDAAVNPDGMMVASKNCQLICSGDAFENCSMWRLVDGMAEAKQFVPRKEGVTKDQLRVHVFAFELKVSFNQAADRFLLREPQLDRTKERSKAVKDYVDSLWALLQSEKKFQFDLLEERRGFVLPPLPDGWGAVTTFSKMPCVLWIKIL